MFQRISVRVPATSANLGCLFDCAGLALALYLDLHVTPRADALVTVGYRGLNPDRIPTDETNLIARTISETLRGWNTPRGFDLEIDNQIPVGVGLGSSAAAIVGSLAVCGWLADRPLPDEELLRLAARREGHPDNVAAAWEGGFTISARHGDDIIAYSCPVPDTLQFVVVVPDYALPTEKARAVLPAEYSSADAVHNLQRAAMVVAQFFSGKASFRPWFFDDRMHQPYRAHLVPSLAEALSFTHPNLLGTCLSGAGPSVLALVNGNAEGVARGIQDALAGREIATQAYTLRADNRGAKGWTRPCCD
jgi:homoserine kinase